MQRNTQSAFVGLQRLKQKQREQLEFFEDWASKEQWETFHGSHYDWWMFPTDEPSSYGFAYTVFEGDIAELKKDKNYIKNYLRGVELLALSWGWNLAKRQHIPNSGPNQKWQNWPIRLYKASRSLQIFGFEAEFESMSVYARELIQSGADMEYNGRDLSKLFK